MKAILHKTYTVHLELTREEAEWLHSQMQNSANLEESVEDQTMREKFFEATKIPDHGATQCRL